MVNTDVKSPHEHENADIYSETASVKSVWANSLSPVSQTSTGQTSLFSNISTPKSAQSGETKHVQDQCMNQSSPRHFQDQHKNQSSCGTAFAEENTLEPIEESTNIRAIIEQLDPDAFHAKTTPSLETVEKAATVKVYFETHLSPLLTDAATPRSTRRKRFEQQLWTMPCSHEDREQARCEFLQAETDHLRQMRVLKTTSLIRQKMKGISIAGYEVVRVLGKGSFGVVRLVTEKAQVSAEDPSSCAAEYEPHKEVYAMKVIRKSEMLRNCQEGHLRAERDFLVASEGSRWIVPLLASFQDNANLYLVMEYMIGGDFLGMLLREDVLDEWVAKWYVAEMILCIEEAHKMRWIHRDVKPDNFLISASGHLKISDFGLAFDGHWAHSQSYYFNNRYSLLEKYGIRVEGDEQDKEEEARRLSMDQGDAASDKTGKRRRCDEDLVSMEELLAWRNRTERRKLARSVVGTSQYMAPEVILGQLYDGRCDWWSVGIILYEVNLPLL